MCESRECVCLTLIVWACPSRTGLASLTWIWAQWKEPNTPTTSNRPSSSLQSIYIFMTRNQIILWLQQNIAGHCVLPGWGARFISHALPDPTSSTPVANVTNYDSFQTGQRHLLPIQLQLWQQHTQTHTCIFCIFTISSHLQQFKCQQFRLYLLSKFNWMVNLDIVCGAV